MNTGELDFGALLNLALQTRKMSQRELAARSGLEESHINHFINGRREPNLTNLLKLCDGLKMSPNELLGRENIKFIRVEIPIFIPLPSHTETHHVFSQDEYWLEHLVKLGAPKA